MDKKQGFDVPPPAYSQHPMKPGGYPVQPIAPPFEHDYNQDCQKVPLYPNPAMAPAPGAPYYGQPIFHGQQPQEVIFVPAAPLTNPPKDYLGYSIFVTVCCCWIIGLFAIIKAGECRSAISVGDRATAEQKSRQAKRLSNIALGIGIGTVVVSVALVIIYVFLVLYLN